MHTTHGHLTLVAKGKKSHKHSARRKPSCQIPSFKLKTRHSIPGSVHINGDGAKNSRMNSLSFPHSGLQAALSYYSSRTRELTKAILHLEGSRVARLKALDPLFPAVPLPPRGAKFLGTCAGKDAVSLKAVIAIFGSQFLTDFWGK